MYDRRVPSASVRAGEAVTVGDDAAPDRVGLRYLALAHRVRKVIDKHMIGSGLSLARWKVLEVLEGNGSIRQTALARELGFAPRSVTQAVESLASDGLVKRTPDPTDGRAKLVTLTDEGAAALAASTNAGEQVLQRIFGALDREQLASLAELLSLIDNATGTA
jgi:DNA-binding MarR family transcriptional regulator